MRIPLLALLLSCLLSTLSASVPARSTPGPLMSDFLGINGHTVQFDAELYAPLCRHVRDYHGMGWDVGEKDTSGPTYFPYTHNVIKWDGEGRRIPKHDGKVNWLTLYQNWIDHGFEIDASIQFGRLTPDKWVNPEEDAYRYGKAFAEFFGPSGEHKLVTAVEIGNEPAGNDAWTDEIYLQVFRGMARGFREGDPKLKILTCTAEPAPSDKYSKDLELFLDHADLYDVINIHKYALIKHWPTYERTHPDDPQNPFLEHVQRSVDWRNQHAPGKPIWITEFGYDAASDEADKTPKPDQFHTVTDRQQAQWIIRSFLMLSMMDLDRAYLYWANDNDNCSFHAASGVTRKYKPKPSYWAMKHLNETLKDFRFKRVVKREDNEAYVFEYEHGEQPSQLIWVAWSPTGTDRTAQLELELPGQCLLAEEMPLEKRSKRKEVKVRKLSGQKVRLEISESPTYIYIRKS